MWDEHGWPVAASTIPRRFIPSEFVAVNASDASSISRFRACLTAGCNESYDFVGRVESVSKSFTSSYIPSLVFSPQGLRVPWKSTRLYGRCPVKKRQQKVYSCHFNDFGNITLFSAKTCRRHLQVSLRWSVRAVWMVFTPKSFKNLKPTNGKKQMGRSIGSRSPLPGSLVLGKNEHLL